MVIRYILCSLVFLFWFGFLLVFSNSFSITEFSRFFAVSVLQLELLPCRFELQDSRGESQGLRVCVCIMH